MAPKACPKGKARSKSRQPGPPQQQKRHWTEAQAERLDAACEVFGGHASVSAREAVQHLYQDSMREAVDFAQQAVRQQGGLGKGAGKLGKGAARRARSRRPRSPSPQPAPGRPGASTDPPVAPAYRSHEAANQMQHRLGENMPTRFHPSRHSVMVCGRPVQAPHQCNATYS